jgi:hypothetical protein
MFYETVEACCEVPTVKLRYPSSDNICCEVFGRYEVLHQEFLFERYIAATVPLYSLFFETTFTEISKEWRNQSRLWY